MLIFQPLIFQRNERIAITIAGARFIADCDLPHERQKKADAAYGGQAAPQLFSYLVIDHGERRLLDCCWVLRNPVTRRLPNYTCYLTRALTAGGNSKMESASGS